MSRILFDSVSKNMHFLLRSHIFNGTVNKRDNGLLLFLCEDGSRFYIFRSRFLASGVPFLEP